MDIVKANANDAVEESVRASLYESILGILGTTGMIVPIGDAKHTPTSTTVTTVGEIQATGTYASAPSGWTTPPSAKGIIPVLNFAGDTSEYVTIADNAFYHFDDSGANPFSVGAWVNVTDTAGTRTMMSVWDTVEATSQEWSFHFGDSDLVSFTFHDESVSQTVNRVSDAALTMGSWIFVVGTYDSTGGADAMGTSGSSDSDNARLFVNGAIVASTANDNASYAAMETSNEELRIGAQIVTGPAAGQLFEGAIAGGPLGPFIVPSELTADAILRLYEVGRRALAL